MLAAALRAHAGSAPRVTPPAAPPTPPVRARRGPSAGWILLIAIVLGLLGGVIAGWLSTI